MPLYRARERLEAINQGIAIGTFSFVDEFPDYRFLARLSGTAAVRTCDQVFDDFLAHCESRRVKEDMAAVTVSSYRRVLGTVWRPEIGKQSFHRVRCSSLVKIADGRPRSKKTYNNAISILNRAFDFGYRDHPECFNPTNGLRCMRLKKKDRPKIDPFAIQVSETLSYRDSSGLGRGPRQL